MHSSIPSLLKNCKAARRPVRQRKHSGFSLIEVLVSILLFTLGILGAAGLILSSIQNNREARQQSTAVLLANELADAVRADKDVALLNSSNNPYLFSYSSLGGSSTLPTASTNCLTSDCQDTGTFSIWQTRRWLERVSSELPNARVSVCFDAAPYDSEGLAKWTCSNSGDTLTIKMAWTSRQIGTGAKDANPGTSSTKGILGEMQEASNRANPQLVVIATPGSKE